MSSLSDTMYINADTLAGLQLIQTENHPNMLSHGPIKASTGAKESLSVFGLFLHLAHTPQGRARLRQMFLRPSMDIHIIQERQATIASFIRPENTTVLETLSKNLRGVKNIRSVMIHLQKGVAVSGKGHAIKTGVWGSLQRFSYHALQTLEAVSQLTGCGQVQVVQKVGMIYLPRLELIANL